MKFLCLHGSGTNSSVLESQTGPLRHELGEGYEYEFVEATIRCAPAEGVEALSSPGHDFYAFFDPADLATLQIAINQLDGYISSKGPFDAVLGFSAGCVLAAMYILHKQQQQQQQSPTAPFKCAVFLSCAEVREEVKYLGIDATSDRIRIPTAHIWGSRDATAPNGGQDLRNLCEPATCLTLIHDGGHELPRSSHLTEACHVIRRVTRRRKSLSGSQLENAADPPPPM
ncbi:serine hydrolase FSH [Xylariaceae sp. FL1651]|nr:serine hydrolase FSH [Xylariaceae sp. FL1651]